MPKRKPLSKKKISPRKNPSAAKPTATPWERKSASGALTEEYSEYLERYELYGEGRPRLSPAEFNRLDDELLDLLAQEGEGSLLSDDQMIRVRELEFLLLDEQSDSSSF